MPLQSIKAQLDRIDDLICRRATGTPEEMAKKLGMCRANWFRWRDQLIGFGLPIAYDHVEKTCYYTQEGEAQFLCWQPREAPDKNKKVKLCEKMASLMT